MSPALSFFKKALRGISAFALSALLAAPSSPQAAEGGSPSETELIAKVLEGQFSDGFVTKARLVHEPLEGTKSVMQLLITGRRDKESSAYLYQLTWPRDRKGEGWLLKKKNDGAWRGVHYIPPDRLQELDRGLLQTPFFGTNLSLFDLTNDYWNWPRQKFIGQETIQRRACKILESKPAGADHPIPYGRVKTWIALEGWVPMKVELFDKSGGLAKTIHSERVMRLDDEYWIPATVVIEDAKSGVKTTLSGSRSDREAKLDDDAFTVEGLKNLD